MQRKAQFMKGGDSPFFFNWRPALRDMRTEVAVSYVQAVTRTIDSIQNSGWLAGCIEQSKADLIGGTGLRLAHKPDNTVLKWDEKQLSDWSRLVERRWEMWCDDKDECDAEGKHTFGELQGQTIDSFYSHGETLALLPRVDRPNAISKIKVKMLPAHKLVQETNDALNMVQGVTMGNWGYPLKYTISLGIGMGQEQDILIPARTPANEKQVMHIFQGAAGQVRGITPFVHVLRVVKQFDQLSDATLQKALIDAIFAATVKSQSPTTDILQALQDEDEQGINGASITDFLTTKASWYQNTKIDFGRAGKVAHLFPGEELEMHTAQNIAGNYEPMAKFLLREVARCVGLTFEDVTGDYSGATYSSVRMSGSKLWPITLGRRKNIPGRFSQETFEDWLTEEVTTERIPFIGGPLAYLAARKAACRADWRGPPKPQADDLKAAKAMEILKKIGIVSDEILCGELGYDWEDVYEQRKRELDARKVFGFPEPVLDKAPAPEPDNVDA